MNTDTEILHWTALGHLHLRQGVTTLVIPQGTEDAILESAQQTVKRLQKRIAWLEHYRAGKTTESPEAL